MKQFHLFIFGLIASGLIACKQADTPAFLRAALPPAPAITPTTTFELLPPARTGIAFVPEIIDTFQYNFILDPYQLNGGGVAVLDVDNDGLQDLFFTHRFNGCRLYHNQGNLRFEDISEASGVAGPGGLKTGVAAVDINADGWTDLYVCRTWLTPVPERRNLLFINNKNGTFSEQAAAWGLDDLSASQCANFFDYDLDGDLDLYVVNHPVDFRTMNNADYRPTAGAPLANSQPPNNEYESDRLYRNDGSRFTDVSRQAGIWNRAYGLSATAADVNDDGRPDLLVANDFIMPDFLYINRGNGRFEDQSERWFSHTSNHSMGCDINDLNNDALPDLCIPDMLGTTPERRKSLMTTMFPERVRLLDQQGYGRQQMRNTLQYHTGRDFAELGCLAGIEATEWSWAPLIADFDHDGWKDLFISAGVYRDLNDLDFFMYTADSVNRTGGISPGRFKSFREFSGKMSSYPVHNFMFQNTGTPVLTDVSDAWGLGEKGFSNGAAYADLDNDGDLDLVLNKLGAPAAVYENKAAQTSANRWLQIKCKGTAANPWGNGAKIWVYAGDRVFYQEMTPYRGFYSSVEPIFQVGLGPAERADKVEIEWLEGKAQTLENVPANQRLLLDIAQARPGRIARPAPAAPLFESLPAPDFTHRETAFDDFSRERLLLHRFSRQGPALAAGDVDGDGRADLFVGGAADQAGAVFRQTATGAFERIPQPALDADARHEDTGACWFDADGDGDLDLYVVSGSNEWPAGNDRYQDRLYRNDGKGRLTRDAAALPAETASGAAVCAFDYDSDGDQDLFVGGRVTPGRFPETPQSFVFQNNGGKFTDVTAAVAPELARLGMATALLPADLNGDGRAELVVCGEWMPLHVFQYDGARFADAGAAFGLENTGGLWNCLAAADLDGDGDLDFVAGNEGLNTRLHASAGAPLRLFAADFDKNGSLDPVVAEAGQGQYYPLAQRNELGAQLPGLVKAKFTRYRAYARATLTDIFPVDALEKSQRLAVHTLASAWFENRNGRLVAHELPAEAQVSCAKRILVRDCTGDGRPDILLLGNDGGNDPETGPYDASRGVLLRGDGRGGFAYVSNRAHGLWAGGEVRDAVWVGERVLAVGVNGGKLLAFGSSLRPQ